MIPFRGVHFVTAPQWARTIQSSVVTYAQVPVLLSHTITYGPLLHIFPTYTSRFSLILNMCLQHSD